MRSQVSVHELTLASQQARPPHEDPEGRPRNGVINAFSKLDVTAMLDDGKTAGLPTAPRSTPGRTTCWRRPRSGTGGGGIAYRQLSNTYIALFSHFIPCGLWEAVYIIEGLLKKTPATSSPTRSTQTRRASRCRSSASRPCRGSTCCPASGTRTTWSSTGRTRGTRYQHIDSLFGDELVDWDLIEAHWSDLLRTAISIRENRSHRSRCCRQVSADLTAALRAAAPGGPGAALLTSPAVGGRVPAPDPVGHRPVRSHDDWGPR